MRFLAYGALLLVWLGKAQALTPLPITLLVEFSPEQAKAYQLQMQHWNLLQQAAGPNLDVTITHVSLQRSLDLVQKSGYCVFNKVKTPEREAQMTFSQLPLSISPSQRLIRLRSNDKLPATATSIDLPAELAAHPNMRIGIAAGSRFGPTVDAIIQRFPKQFYAVSGENVHVKLWQMLQLGRVDALIDYQVRIELLEAQTPSSKPYTITPIRGQNMLVKGYIACNKQTHGEQSIQYVDRLMATPALQSALVQSFKQYFPEPEWQQIRQDLQQIYPAASIDSRP
jgi:uncharacterized protein (TIGR02285 family)